MIERIYPPPKKSKRGIECLRKMARPTSSRGSVLEQRDLSDDEDMEKFLKDADDHWQVGCMLRNVQCRRMSRKKFDEFMKSLDAPIDDDKPLKEMI